MNTLPLVGRERELAVLTAALDAARIPYALFADAFGALILHALFIER